MYRTLPLHLLGAAVSPGQLMERWMDGLWKGGAACVQLPLDLQPFLPCSLRCKSESEGFQFPGEALPNGGFLPVSPHHGTVKLTDLPEGAQL